MLMRGSKLTYFTAALLAVLSIGTAPQAVAGLDLYMDMPSLSVGKCVNQPQPNGVVLVECTGTLYGIRTQRADPRRWVEFGVSESGSLLFWMNYNGTLYTCAAPNTQSWKDAFVAAAGASAFFDMWLNPATGQCLNFFGATGSQFKGAFAL